MAPRAEDDWSDSDDEELGGVETTVLLGVPDGPIDAASDINDVAVSRIGGRPAFLASIEPPFDSSQCKVCSNPMELLVQMWCPFEDSPMDRALYIWGCPRASCQGKNPTVRAWRGLRHNEKYAAKLEIKLAKKRERERAKAEALAKEAEKKAAAKVNPFSMNSSAPNPFGFGAQVFGASAPETEETSAQENSESASDADSDSDSEGSLITALTTVKIGSDSRWPSSPSYPPLYLSTCTEYLPAKPKSSLPANVQILDPSDEPNSFPEIYENSLDVDQVFDKFSKRVEIEPEQCVRYDLGGTPLPFASDGVFKRLFPDPKEEPLPVTKAAFKVVQPQKRVYDASSIPACPSCGGRRVFECQLMPNLINVLRKTTKKNMTDEERRAEVERQVKKGGSGMEWGTCMVFSCEKDCDDGKETWREEYVLIQWDT